MKILALALAVPALQPNLGHAAELTISDVASGGAFGSSVHATSNTGLVGAPYVNSLKGAAYIYRNLNTAAGTIAESAKLVASDATSRFFGNEVRLSGSTGLIGARNGKTYVFRNLDTATGTITENAALTPSTLSQAVGYGSSVGLSGAIGLVGAPSENSGVGAVYLFRGLDTATGTITETAKLILPFPTIQDAFGTKVSVAGKIGLIGAPGTWGGGTSARSGAAHVFLNLDTATGNVAPDFSLEKSDAGAQFNLQSKFGDSVSLDGTTGLVGASDAYYSGAAYLYRGLDLATGGVTENAKLTASDSVAYDRDYFGFSASLSGNNALISAYGDDQFGTDSGSAYLFSGLDTATGTITEIVKINASDAAANDFFGFSASLDGDNILVGAYQKNSNSGKTYTGSFSSMTTLDTGNVDKFISSIDFVSRRDWVIGQTTDANSVALEAGSRATVIASGKKVYVGKDAGSDNNTLFINGTLTATEVRVGATGNVGNGLILEPNGVIPAGSNVFVASGSSIGGNGVLAGSLTMAPGAKLEFNSNGGLVVRQSAALDSTFGVDDILGLDGNIAANTYSLISDSTTDFTTLGLQNFGAGNAYFIGGTKAAYLESTAPGDLSLIVYTIPIPVVTNAATTSGNVGTSFFYQITATNLPDSFSALSLPAGLTVNTSTGVISGIPTTAGTFNASVQATNAGGTGTKAVTFTIIPLPPVITSAGTASGRVGTALSYQITATNTPTSFSVLTLPAGLAINTTTGLISGIPTTAGTFSATVRATHAGGTGTKAVTFTIVPLPPVISSAATASGEVGTTFAYQIRASNSPTRFSALRLPAGLTLDTTSGRITGVPTSAGTFTASLQAINAGGTGTRTVTFTITKTSTEPTLSITTPSSLRVTITTASFTIAGRATDDVSPMNVEYRIKAPGSRKFGPFKSIALSGTAKSKPWSQKLDRITTGTWQVEFRARDARGNQSDSKIVTITRR